VAAAYDLVVRGGHVTDPSQGLDGPADIAIAGDRVVACGQDLRGAAAAIVDARGLWVVPGLVDLHVHLSEEDHGRLGHAMLAAAGVTTALDLAGPLESVVAEAATGGAGLRIGVVEAVVPGRHASAGASRQEARRALERLLRSGSIGVKMHVDHGWDATSTGTFIDVANSLSVWAASHCGTTATGSDVLGLRETLELCGSHRLHVAHVNSYCRGLLADPAEEARTTVGLLRAHPHVVSESYLAENNGSWGECARGRPVLERVVGWLLGAGFDGTEDGLREAIASGWARVSRPGPIQVELVSGAEGVSMWEAAGTKVGICLPVNPWASRLLLATSKNAAGQFDVTALATDGGGIPRNDTVRHGLSLVDLGVLSRSELVAKASWHPARLLGLTSAGRLTSGADADLAIVDPRTREVVTTVANGVTVYDHGRITGRGTRLLTTERGVAALVARGIPTQVLDLEASGLYAGMGATC
jgi:imidazolonepropionase-like amidohydrolase